MTTRINSKTGGNYMGGGMAKKYSLGGGADTGTIGTLRSMKIKDKFPFKDFGKTDYAASNREARKDLKPSQRLKSLRQSATPGYLPKPAAPKGKMGGGMMNKPMGYKSGTMVKARGCKLGRTRPTKMY